MSGSSDNLVARLQAAGRRDLGDFITFEVSPDGEHSEIRADGMHYDGLRFRAECKFVGKRFGVDVAFGDPISGDPELIVVRDVLAFRDHRAARAADLA